MKYYNITIYWIFLKETTTVSFFANSMIDALSFVSDLDSVVILSCSVDSSCLDFLKSDE